MNDIEKMEDSISDPRMDFVYNNRNQWKAEKQAKQKKRIKGFLILCCMVLFIFVVSRIKIYMEENRVNSSMEELADYALFIPDSQIFSDMSREQISDADRDENTDLYVYEAYKETMLACKEKWDFTMVSFCTYQVGYDKGEYIIYSYDTKMTDELLELSFFELEEGSTFSGNANELWAVGDLAKRPGNSVAYVAGNGEVYKFEIVGKLKQDFIPTGELLDYYTGNFIWEVPNDTPAYILNPYCQYLNDKTKASATSSVFIRFNEENEAQARKELEKYGSFHELEFRK